MVRSIEPKCLLDAQGVSVAPVGVEMLNELVHKPFRHPMALHMHRQICHLGKCTAAQCCPVKDKEMLSQGYFSQEAISRKICESKGNLHVGRVLDLNPLSA